MKTKLKSLLDDIATCDPARDLKRLIKAVKAGKFTVWKLQKLRTAFNRRCAARRSLKTLKNK